MGGTRQSLAGRDAWVGRHPQPPTVRRHYGDDVGAQQPFLTVPEDAYDKWNRAHGIK